jgi:hypothetical protein
MVKWTGKLAVLVIAMSVWASPLMACMVPDALLTNEERECCRNMANDCGQMEMPASHSCCKVVTRQIDPYLINSRFPTIHSAPAVTLFVAVDANPLTQAFAVASSPLHGHSPPVSPLHSISILRI